MKILLFSSSLIYPLTIVAFCILLTSSSVTGCAILLVLNFLSGFILNNFNGIERYKSLNSLVHNLLRSHQAKQFILRQVGFLLLLETQFPVGDDSRELAIYSLGTILIGYYWLPSLCNKALNWHVLSNLYRPINNNHKSLNFFNPANPVTRGTTKQIFALTKVFELSLYVAIIWNSSKVLDLLIWLNLIFGWSTIVLLTLFLFGITKFNLGQGTSGTFELLKRIKPAFLFHFSAESPNHLYQIEQWLPSMEESGQSFAIITRELDIFLAMSKFHPNIPILYVRKLQDLERTISSSVKGILYVNPGMKNSHFLRLRSQIHVQLGHGESDKLASAAKQMRAYDIIAVAGQGAVDRYKKAGIDIHPNQFKRVGRPQLKNLKRSTGNTPIKTILYAPTWESPDQLNNYSSVKDFGLELLKFLASQCPEIKIIIKLHPLTGSVDKSLIKTIEQMESYVTGLNLNQQRSKEQMHEFHGVKSNISISELYDKADCLMCDISSVLGDFLYTNKLSFIFDTNEVEESKLRNNYPTTRGSHIITSTSDFNSIMVPAFRHDSKQQERLETSKYIYEGSTPNPDSKFFEMLSEISN